MKTRPYITERVLMGRIESHQTKPQLAKPFLLKGNFISSGVMMWRKDKIMPSEKT